MSQSRVSFIDICCRIFYCSIAKAVLFQGLFKSENVLTAKLHRCQKQLKRDVNDAAVDRAQK